LPKTGRRRVGAVFFSANAVKQAGAGRIKEAAQSSTIARIILQPTMVAIAALHDGIRDARDRGGRADPHLPQLA